MDLLANHSLSLTTGDDMEGPPKPVRDMTAEERAIVQARMDQLIASGLIKFAGPFNTREWRVVGPAPEHKPLVELDAENPGVESRP